MEKRARAKPGDMVRNWRQASLLHRFPLIWVDLIYLWYLCVRADDTFHFLCITIVIVLHADLYLLVPRSSSPASSRLFYLLVQSTLLLAISLLAGSWLMALGLSGALAMKTVALLERAEFSSAVLLAYLLLYATAIGLDVLQARNDRNGLNWTYLMPFLVCAASSALLFVRQTCEYKRLRQLLSTARTECDSLYAVQAELMGKHAQLAASLVEVEEATLTGERQRLARELHDTLTQDLVSLVLQLEAIDARLANEQLQRAREMAQMAMQRARVALDETRRAIYNLRTDLPAPQSLAEIAQAEIRRFSQATGISCQSDLRLLATVPVRAGEQILQAIKEGLTNIARHAHAHTVWIGLRSSGATFVVDICDDGRGFAPARTEAGHYGLLGLRERAEQLGGELQIESAPGEGTRLRMSLPRRQEEREVCTA